MFFFFYFDLSSLKLKHSEGKNFDFQTLFIFIDVLSLCGRTIWEEKNDAMNEGREKQHICLPFLLHYCENKDVRRQILGIFILLR